MERAVLHEQAGFQTCDLDRETAQEGSNVFVSSQSSVLHFLKQRFGQHPGFIESQIIREISLGLTRNVDGQQECLVRPDRQTGLAQDRLKR